MPQWLQIVLAVCATAVTVGGLLVAFGRDSGITKAEIDTLRHEVDRLREWRHSGVNFQQAVQIVNLFDDRLKRLERIVLNGKG